MAREQGQQNLRKLKRYEKYLFSLWFQGGMVGMKVKDKEGGRGKKGGKRGDKDDDEGQIHDGLI